MQYATNISALTVLRFVKPAMFELITLSWRGILTAKTEPSVIPTIRPCKLSGPSVQTRMIPIIDVAQFTIIIGMRLWGTHFATATEKVRKVICAAPRGICIRKDLEQMISAIDGVVYVWVYLSVENPKPRMMMVPNWVVGQLGLQSRNISGLDSR